MDETDRDRPLVRKLHEGDHGAFEAHLLGLDAASRRMRFGMVAGDAFLRRYAARSLTVNAIIHGAFLDAALIGVAELRPLGEVFVRDAEMAFSVTPGLRNAGIGTALFARALRSARNRGFTTLFMTCLRNNPPMLALARKFAADIRVEFGDILARVDVPERTMLSRLGEALDDASARVVRALDRQRRWLAPKPGATHPLTR